MAFAIDTYPEINRESLLDILADIQDDAIEKTKTDKDLSPILNVRS